MWVSTFHSMCVRILRAEAKTLGLKSSFSIYDADDSQAADDAWSAASSTSTRSGTRPASLSAQISNLKNELVTPEAWADKAGNAHEKVLAEAYTRYQRRLRRGARARLRRPDHDDGRAAAGPSRRRRALPAPVPARPGRRVPGHQPRAVHAGPRTRPAAGGAAARPSSPSSATPTSRSTRSAARRSATSSSSSATTRTRRRSCSSRTTARRRRSSPRPTPSSPATPTASRRTCGPRPARASRSPATSPRTSTTRRRGSPSRSTSCPTSTACRRPTSRCSTGPTRSRECSRRCSSGSACRTRSSAACASTSARRSATRWPTCASIANPDDVVSLRRILNTPRRGIGDRAEACVEVLRRPRADLVRRGARPRRRRASGWRRAR